MFVFEGAFIFISAITSIFCIFEVVVNNLSIMSLENAGHILHAAVVYFHSTFVEDLVAFDFLGNVFFKSEKYLSYICLNIFTKW